jgi:AraC family transcriptional regulator, positive regulator of tynA and feaB
MSASNNIRAAGCARAAISGSPPAAQPRIRGNPNFVVTPQLDFEGWRAFLRTSCGNQPEVVDPNAFAGWVRPLRIYGLAAAALKIECGFGVMDSGCSAYRSERTYRDIRFAGADYYYAVFQVAGRSVFAQNGEIAQLAVGDFALLDAARPAACFAGDSQWLRFQLPRQSLISHLGFEPHGGFYASGGTAATRLLFDLVQEADTAEASGCSPADSYLQLAVYDLLGALFAPSNSSSVSRHADRLFTRVYDVIKNGFADPDLGPRKIAADVRVSLRYLQKLFTARGSTCSDFIYSVRLDQAARLLRRRASLGTNQPLTEIAYACGFRDYAHFARKFRQRFGHSPGAVGQETRASSRQ